MRFVSPLSLAAFLVLPLAVFAPKGVAPLFALTASAATVGHIAAKPALPPMPARFGAALFAFLLFAATSAPWSLTPTRSFQAAWPLAGILLGVVCLLGLIRALDDSERIRVGKALLSGTVFGLLLLLDRELGRHLTVGGVGRPLLGAVASAFGVVVNAGI